MKLRTEDNKMVPLTLNGTLLGIGQHLHLNSNLQQRYNRSDLSDVEVIGILENDVGVTAKISSSKTEIKIFKNLISNVFVGCGFKLPDFQLN